MKNAIVTGGAGFIGSCLVDKLIETGCDVLILDDLRTGNAKNINNKARVSVTSFDNVPLQELEKADVVFHLAASVSVEESLRNPSKYFENNHAKTIRLLEKICKCDTKPIFIFSSTSAVYGEPLYVPTDELCQTFPRSPYGLSKLQIEELLPWFANCGGLRYNILRYFNVYGERMSENGGYPSVIRNFLKQKKEGKSLTIFGSGDTTRDFVYVGDVAQANILAAKKPKNDVFNIGSGMPYSIKEIANMMSDKIVFLQERIEPKATQCDPDKAREILEWRPKMLLSQWLQNQGVLR